VADIKVNTQRTISPEWQQRIDQLAKTGVVASSETTKQVEQALKPFVDEAFDTLSAIALGDKSPPPIELFHYSVDGSGKPNVMQWSKRFTRRLTIAEMEVADLLKQPQVEIGAMLRQRLQARFEDSPFELSLEAKVTGDVGGDFATRYIHYTKAQVTRRPEFNDLFEAAARKMGEGSEPEGSSQDAWSVQGSR
jgi:hypothetical protein